MITVYTYNKLNNLVNQFMSSPGRSFSRSDLRSFLRSEGEKAMKDAMGKFEMGESGHRHAIKEQASLEHQD